MRLRSRLCTRKLQEWNATSSENYNVANETQYDTGTSSVNRSTSTPVPVQKDIVTYNTWHCTVLVHEYILAEKHLCTADSSKGLGAFVTPKCGHRFGIIVRVSTLSAVIY
jgi:hypothetical protein